MIARLASILTGLAIAGFAALLLVAACAPDLGESSAANATRSAEAGRAGPSPSIAGARSDDVPAAARGAYARGDFPEAQALAAHYLAGHPDDLGMRRLVVSASCITGDRANAQRSYSKLPAGDQAGLQTRCARYGVALAATP